MAIVKFMSLLNTIQIVIGPPLHDLAGESALELRGSTGQIPEPISLLCR